MGFNSGFKGLNMYFILDCSGQGLHFSWRPGKCLYCVKVSPHIPPTKSAWPIHKVQVWFTSCALRNNWISCHKEVWEVNCAKSTLPTYTSTSYTTKIIQNWLVYMRDTSSGIKHTTRRYCWWLDMSVAEHSQRISWLGHLERMEEDRMPKTTFTQELEGMRQRGRPWKRWREEVERDLQVLGVRKWRVGREKWRGIVRQAKWEKKKTKHSVC